MYSFFSFIYIYRVGIIVITMTRGDIIVNDSNWVIFYKLRCKDDEVEF